MKPDLTPIKMGMRRWPGPPDGTPITQRRSTVPEGGSGRWKVERFEIPKGKLHEWALIKYAIKGRPLIPGIFTHLTYLGRVIMCDTPAEMRDCEHLFSNAHGNVLVNGLGLGWCVEELLREREEEGGPLAEHVTVIEIDKDVINLVGSYMKTQFASRLEIITPTL